MKKRLNVLTVLMLLLMAAQVVMTFVSGADAFAEGWRQGTTDSHSAALWPSFWGIVEALVVMVAAVLSFACFVRFILNVNRNEIFEWGNVNLLRLTGIGLAVVVLMISADELLRGNSFKTVFNDYFDVLIFCVFNLIVAEAFAIGLKLKEEQELTI